MDNKIDISVIVPVYNVEEYLEACLDSLLCQGNVNLEVIMIDDGSTDTSGVIADEYADKYDNFNCYHIENGGLGHARNYAVPHAKGKYIIFLDSDDIVPDYTYEKMLRLAEKHRAEMTICNVERFNSTKNSPSHLHNKAFRRYEEVSHIARNHSLLNDTTSWNKLIRKDFYDKNKFAFPENILYEDIPVAIPMHYLCNKVAMLNEIGYLWRIRDGGSKSITQNTSSMKNLDDRLTILRMLDNFFSSNITDDELIIDKEYKCLDVDLKIFVNMCASIPKDEAYEMLDKINEYIDAAVSDEAFEKLSVQDKQRYHHVRERNLEGLIKFLDYKDYNSEPINEENGRLKIELPNEVFSISDRDVTTEIERSTANSFVEKINIKKNSIELICHLYKRRINVRAGEQNVQAYLSNYNQRFELATEAFDCTDLTVNRGKMISTYSGKEASYCYDGTGFKINLDINDMIDQKCEDGLYHIELEYSNRFFEGAAILKGMNKNTKVTKNKTLVSENSSTARLIITQSKEINIEYKNNSTFINDILVKDKNLLVKTSRDLTSLLARPVLNSNYNNVVIDRVESKTFSVSLDKLKSGKGYVLYDADENALLANDQTPGMVVGSSCAIIAFGQSRIPVITIEDSFSKIESFEKKGREAIIRIKRYSLYNPRSIKTARLVIENKYAEMITCLSETSNFDTNENSLSSDFIVNLTRPEIVKDLYEGEREISLEYELNDGSYIREQIISDCDVSYSINNKELRAELGLSECARLMLKSAYVWPAKQASTNNRKILINKEYPKYLKKAIVQNRILFESMWGKNYSCNPQAIYEFIDEHYPGYECIWSLNDPKIPIKGNAKRVKKGSLEYYYYLATSKYLVNNVNFPNNYKKRDGQIEIQTMHGTPLKSLGLDVESDFPTKADVERYIIKNQRWDFLIVQGRFMENKAYQIFRFEKDILKCGYPRTDKLMNINNDKAKRTKKQLGLPSDKKVILYTPTWRVKNRFEMKLDLSKMKETLSDDYILVVRLHHLCAAGYTVPEDKEFIYDMTKYSYVEDLYLISDVLITDYSSVMFDYALLNKPMVFYTYDMEEYCNKLRGLYIDFREEAPGPICMTSEEVIDAISNIDEEMDKCRERIEAFKEKFLTYEQSNSTEALVNEVFDTNMINQRIFMLKRTFKDNIYYNGKAKVKNVLRPIYRRIKKRR